MYIVYLQCKRENGLRCLRHNVSTFGGSMGFALRFPSFHLFLFFLCNFQCSSDMYNCTCSLYKYIFHEHILATLVFLWRILVGHVHVCAGIYFPSESSEIGNSLKNRKKGLTQNRFNHVMSWSCRVSNLIKIQDYEIVKYLLGDFVNWNLVRIHVQATWNRCCVVVGQVISIDVDLFSVAKFGPIFRRSAKGVFLRCSLSLARLTKSIIYIFRTSNTIRIILFV